MKTSSEHRARARFARFTPVPPSVLQALRSLRNATAQALYNLLIEKCFGFGQGFSDLSYAQLAKALGRNTRTIATMAKRLRDLKLVQIERLSDGSYRWRVPVLAEEVKEDPRGVLAVRSGGSSSPSLNQASDPIPIPIGYDRLIMGDGVRDRIQRWSTDTRAHSQNPTRVLFHLLSQHWNPPAKASIR